MAEVAKSGNPSLSSLTTPHNDQLSGLLAGETIAPGDACYIRTSDNKVMRSTGAAANAAAKVRGYAMGGAALNEPVTLASGIRFRYGAALSPGADLYLSATVPGGLSDAATTGGVAPIGYVVDATRVKLWESRY